MPHNKKTVLRITLSPNEFEEIDGKLYHKELKREHVVTLEPEWWARAEELLRQGISQFDVAMKLNAEGYKSVHGKRVTESMIRNHKWYRSKREVL